MLQQSKINPPQANSISTSSFTLNSHSNSVKGKPTNFWIFDTGSTDHISYNKSLFINCQNIDSTYVSLPDGSQVVTSMSGTVHLSASLTLYDVLYVPSFHVNLIFVAKLVETNDCSVHINSDSFHILQNRSKEMIGITNLHKGLYILDPANSCSPPSGQHSLFNSVTNNSCNTWHLRLGHVSRLGLQNISKLFPSIGCNNKLDPCDSCHFARQRKLPFPNSTTVSSAPFNILHADLWGPFSTISTLGHKYFLTLVDDCTRYTWVIFLKTKDQTKTSLISFIAYIENQFHTSLKFLRSNNGTEFLAVTKFISSKGIIHQKSCVQTPQQNGIVERKHQHILNVARSLYFHSNVPLTLWNFCVQHAIHLTNILPTPLLKSKSPH